MFCPERKSSAVIWKTLIPPNFNSLKCLNNTSYPKKTFWQKYRFALLLWYYLGDLCTCFGGWVIPVSVQGNCWWIFCGGWAETKTGFCLSSRQKNLQPKNKVFRVLPKIFWWNIPFLISVTMAFMRKDTHKINQKIPHTGDTVSLDRCG